MKFFRKKTVVKFDEIEVEVYEVNLRTLKGIADGYLNDEIEILADNTSLSVDELENASPKAIRKLFDEFKKLNSDIFQETDENPESSKKN